MMGKFITGLLLVLALSCIHEVQAFAPNELSAADLYLFCSSDDSNAKFACKYFLLGVVQGIGVAAAKANDKEHFCFPDDVSQSQLVEIFLKTSRKLKQKYPDDMNMPAVGIVGAAMMSEFPCPNQRPR
jgi:Rap1a immunity proteins